MIKIAVKIFFLTSCVAFANQVSPEVEIGQGLLRGKHRQTWKGRTFSAFTGIPYAEPPVGELRFKAPVPAGSWKGTLDASKPHAICPQINVYVNDFTFKGDEDCLYLNVYTPQSQLPNSENKLLPVMFYIHGGGWMCGNANDYLYGPDILLDKNVILVTTNYRLGPLGFLSTGDNVVPGNNGLKDQNLALRWVKKNIAHFGGDPEKITIFGQSAGGASTHYHILSPLSKDLIKGAIMHSGTALAPWALATKDLAADNTARLAKYLNCPTKSSQETIECMRNIKAEDIVQQDLKFLEWSYDPMIPFKPVVEPDLEGAFLTEEPIDIISSGKAANVPIMTGFTSEDGAFKSAILFNDTNLIPQLDEDFNRIAPFALVYDQSAANKDDISRSIRQFYFGDRKIDGSVKTEITEMFTDAWFLLPEDATVRAHFKYSKQPVYYFLFGFRGSVSFGTLAGDPSHDYGVSHCDELIYLFNSHLYDNYHPNDSEKKMNDIMTTLWTNFAETGNPTPETDALIHSRWEPVKSDKLEYYLIKSDSEIGMDENLFSGRAKFWRNVPFAPRWTKFKDEL